jgi:hypothetical protein
MYSCSHCGEEHKKLPHPTKPGRVVAYCQGRAVFEGWGSSTSTPLSAFADLGIKTAEEFLKLGIETVGNIEDVLFSPDWTTMRDVEGVGKEGITTLKNYFMDGVLKLLVTGTGRCGTRYFSKRLTSVGVPCHHELIGLGGLSGLRERARKVGALADSSWLAAAFLQHIPANVRIVHLVRHPIKVIESLMRMRFFNRNNQFQRYTDFAVGALPGIKQHRKILDRAVYFYIYWNEKIATQAQGPRIVHRIEDDDSGLLQKLGATTSQNLFENVLDNHRGGKSYKLDWTNVDFDLRVKLERQSKAFGYHQVFKEIDVS